MTHEYQIMTVSNQLMEHANSTIKQAAAGYMQSGVANNPEDATRKALLYYGSDLCKMIANTLRSMGAVDVIVKTARI